MRSSAMLHLNTVQYIFLLAFQVKSYREDHQVATEQKKMNTIRCIVPVVISMTTPFINCHHIKRQQQTGACWWLQNQQKHFNIYIL